jgi:hypothetical protein
VRFDAPRVEQNPADEASGDTREGARAPHLQRVAVRKNLDLVWVWFYKEVAPTALGKAHEKF